jgi:hypothetical protein
MVVVIDHRELAQPEVAGQRRRLGGNTFHEVAVAGERPNSVIDDGVLRTVKVIRQEPLGYGHADCVAESLAQRACGSLDSRSMAALRMTRRA